MDTTVSCECGALKGSLKNVSAESSNRLVCYCDALHDLGAPVRVQHVPLPTQKMGEGHSERTPLLARVSAAN